MNEVRLTGRLTKEPLLKNIGSKGTTLCEFSLAINSGQGEQKTAHYFDCKAWKAVAGQIADNYRKGDLVDVKGFLTQEVWTQADGQKRSKVVIVVMDHRVPGERGDDDRSEPAPARTVPVTNTRSGAGGYASRSPSAPPPGDLEIPF